jgi:LysR family glycine cleavage system transcriptional activator
MAKDKSLPPLNALQAFHAAGVAGSFQGAARALNVTPSAISHQIRGLEEWLERPLFLRGTRQVTLTREGKALLKTVSAAFARIAQTSENVRGARGSVLRISALSLFTNAWLIPRLGYFEKKHPDISLEIETTNRVVDLAREKIDIAIRNLREVPQGLAAIKLLDVRPVPMCTAKTAALLKTPSDLAEQTLIHLSSRRGVWSAWLRAVGCGGLKSRRKLVFDTMPAALEAAAQGRGVAIGIDGLMQEWEKTLVRPFAHRVPGDASYYLVHRKGDGVRPDIRAFTGWVTDEMAAFKRRAAR